MLNRYLNNNPIEWLLQENDYSVKYLTARDILKNLDAIDYEMLEKNSTIRNIPGFKKSGVLGDTVNHDTYHKGTVWSFSEAITRGLDSRTPSILKTADFICDRLQTRSGGFSLNWNPKIATGCRTGDMVRYMLKAKINDNKVNEGINWILKNQRHDGGWLHCPLGGLCDTMKLMLFKKPGNGLKRENDSKVRSCPFASISCALALTDFPEKNENHFNTINRAARFFLDNDFFQSEDNFSKPGFPVLRQYDISLGLLFVSQAGFFKDRKTSHTFNYLMSLQKNDGSWSYSNFSAGMLFKNRKVPDNIDKWSTLNVLKTLKEGEKSIHEGVSC